jgi:hypothetical protein
MILGPTSPLDRLLDRFWIWKRFWQAIVIGYNTGTGFYTIGQSYSLTLQWSINTKSSSPDKYKLHPPLTDYWTDFESESGFEKLFILATILVQVFIDQSYSLTPQMPIDWTDLYRASNSRVRERCGRRCMYRMRWWRRCANRWIQAGVCRLRGDKTPEQFMLVSAVSRGDMTPDQSTLVSAVSEGVIGKWWWTW